MSHVLSVNLGTLEQPAPHTSPTAINKRPVDAIEVRAPGPKTGGLGSGVVGDDIGSRKHHGGDFQAVYAVAREELDWWQEQLGRSLPNGFFGENLTTTGQLVDEAVVGERWRIGSAVVLTVSGPRIPCATFARHLGERGWVKTFTQHQRSGAYLAVASPGIIRPGDEITVIERPRHGVTVIDTFAAMSGDRAALHKVVEARVLNDVDHGKLERRLATQPDVS